MEPAESPEEPSVTGDCPLVAGNLSADRRVLRRISIGLILWVSLLVRIGALIVHQEIATLPQGGMDEAGFERAAWTLSQQGREGLGVYLSSGALLIGYLGSFVYDLTGRAPYVLGFLMVLLGTGLVYVVYRTALELWEDVEVARLVAWACALFPQLVQHSALFLRETPVAFCLAASTLHAVRFLKKRSFPQIGWFALWVFIGTLFHSGIIFAIPAFLVGMVLVRDRGSRGRVGFYTVNLTAALALVAVIVWVDETGYGLQKFGGSFEGAWQTFEFQESSDPIGGAAFPEWMRIRGGVSEVWKVPVRYAAFVFSPLLPFLVRNARHWLGVLDAGLYVLLFWACLRHWRGLWVNRPAMVILLVALCLFFVYALGVSNFGTAIRHRAKISPLLLLVAVGAAAVRRRPVHGQSLS